MGPDWPRVTDQRQKAYTSSRWIWLLYKAADEAKKAEAVDKAADKTASDCETAEALEAANTAAVDVFVFKQENCSYSCD